MLTLFLPLFKHLRTNMHLHLHLHLHLHPPGGAHLAALGAEVLELLAQDAGAEASRQGGHPGGWWGVVG